MPTYELLLPNITRLTQKEKQQIVSNLEIIKRDKALFNKNGIYITIKTNQHVPVITLATGSHLIYEFGEIYQFLNNKLRYEVAPDRAIDEEVSVDE